MRRARLVLSSRAIFDGLREKITADDPVTFSGNAEQVDQRRRAVSQVEGGLVGKLAGMVGPAVTVEDDRLTETGDVEAADPTASGVLDPTLDRIGQTVAGALVGFGIRAVEEMGIGRMRSHGVSPPDGSVRRAGSGREGLRCLSKQGDVDEAARPGPTRAGPHIQDARYLGQSWSANQDPRIFFVVLAVVATTFNICFTSRTRWCILFGRETTQPESGRAKGHAGKTSA